MILNVISHNIQDVTLLFKHDEIKAMRSENNKVITEAKNALIHQKSDFKLLSIGDRPVSDLKLRWINFILYRTYDAMRHKE